MPINISYTAQNTSAILQQRCNIPGML